MRYKILWYYIIVVNTYALRATQEIERLLNKCYYSFTDYYYVLSTREKEYLTEQFYTVLKNHPLTDYACLYKLLAAAKQLNALYAQETIVGLGQSPAYLLETARILHTAETKKRFCLVAFSHSQDSFPICLSPEQKEQYKAYLSRIALDPQSIIKRYHNHACSTVIIDHVITGRSLVAFLLFLYTWAQEHALTEYLQKALIVHYLKTPGSQDPEELQAFLRKTRPSLIVRNQPYESVLKIGKLPCFNDRLVPKCLTSSYTLSIQAHLVLFRIRHFVEKLKSTL